MDKIKNNEKLMEELLKMNEQLSMIALKYEMNEKAMQKMVQINSCIMELQKELMV